MAITTLVLGFTGEGKSYSIKNLNPEDTGIIQITSKPLPFRNNQDFAKRIRVSCDFMDIQRALLQAKSSVIVIDDFQYLMINEQLKGETAKLPAVIDYAVGSGHFITEVMEEYQNIIDNNIDTTDLYPDVIDDIEIYK